MEKIKQFFSDIWSISLVQFIVYLLIAFVAAFLAKFIITKLFKLIKLDKLLDKWGVNEGMAGTSMSLVGKIVYLVVFLLFLPTALNAIGLVSDSGPLTGLASQFISYLPNIIAAAILLYVGIFLAIIIGQVVLVLLRKTRIDSLLPRKDEEKNLVLLSDIIVKIVMAVIILITIVQALTVLDISAISTPALGIIHAIFGAIPSIILAAAVISCGLLVTTIACGLLTNVLVAVGFDGIVAKVLPNLKASATKIVVNIVKTLIIIFVVAQGVEVLGLTILSTIVSTVVAYVPLVIKSAIIAAVAFIGASMLENVILKSGAKCDKLAKIVKVAIYVLAGFMILSQLDIASTIVNTAFVVTIAAVAIAFALAFGLGGRDFAKKTLDRVDDKLDSKEEDDK
jgi:hypothetical protein